MGRTKKTIKMDVHDFYDNASMMSSSTMATSAVTGQGRVHTYIASQNFADPEQLRQCPFDPVHTIQAYRYQRHILRCRKQNPEKAKDFRSCQYNAMHFFHKNEIEQHRLECPDKTRDRAIPQGRIMKSITDDININMEMWDTHESTRPDDLIRPRREEILKLKKALREKYPREEAQFQFDD